MSKNKYIFLLLLVNLAGCATPQQHAEIVLEEEANAYTVSYPAALRGAYFFKNDKVIKYCAEPAPDIALDTLQKLTAELSGTMSGAEKIDGKLATELSSKVVQLAGRTELLLLAREMLYRACELNINNGNADVTNLYNRVATLIEALSQADKISAEADLLKEKAALVAAGQAFDKSRQEQNK